MKPNRSTTTGRTTGAFQLSRPARRAWLVLHVAVSVAWLGLSLCLLVLGVSGATTDSAETGAAAYRAMKIFGDWMIIPISLLTLVSGVVLALGTSWGLARYRWVWTKFWLTLATAAASVFALRSGIDDAAAEVDRLRAGEPVPLFADLVAAPAVSTTAYLFMTAISVLKPWGLTARGRRWREAGRARGHVRRGPATGRDGGTPAPDRVTPSPGTPAPARGTPAPGRAGGPGRATPA
ncbi:DUF2269 domain-containing protein [Streptomyces sp. NPDC018031]|uniref:DUF2269 domain-containing protein n=1 Tax=Streptomyces sp. NPDC018031 TaxID=3365033 RepID=UPI003792B03B